MKLEVFLANLKSGKLPKKQHIKLTSEKSPHISDEEAELIASQLKSYQLPIHFTLDLTNGTISDNRLYSSWVSFYANP